MGNRNGGAVVGFLSASNDDARVARLLPGQGWVTNELVDDTHALDAEGVCAGIDDAGGTFMTWLYNTELAGGDTPLSWVGYYRPAGQDSSWTRATENVAPGVSWIGGPEATAVDRAGTFFFAYGRIRSGNTEYDRAIFRMSVAGGAIDGEATDTTSLTFMGGLRLDAKDALIYAAPRETGLGSGARHYLNAQIHDTTTRSYELLDTAQPSADPAIQADGDAIVVWAASGHILAKTCDADGTCFGGNAIVVPGVDAASAPRVDYADDGFGALVWIDASNDVGVLTFEGLPGT
jgi:hypothetical protein